MGGIGRTIDWGDAGSPALGTAVLLEFGRKEFCDVTNCCEPGEACVPDCVAGAVLVAGLGLRSRRPPDLCATARTGAIAARTNAAVFAIFNIETFLNPAFLFLPIVWLQHHFHY
jgi:hypothetical protein